MNDHKLKTEENNKGIFKQIGKDFKGNLQNILNEGDFKDLKEIIDYQNDTKNKPYLLLIKKRIRETDVGEFKIDKILENFNNISLDHNKLKINPEIFIKNNSEESKNEFDQKQDFIKQIIKSRNNILFSNIYRPSNKEEIGKLYRNFYPCSTSKEYFQKSMVNNFSEEIKFKVNTRVNTKQNEFWDRRKFLKGTNDPDFEKVKVIFNKIYGENDTKFINLDADNMLIVRNGEKLKIHEIQIFNDLIKSNGLTPAVQIYEMDNNLNLMKTQENEYEDEDNTKNKYTNDDEIDSNDEDNPGNDYPDESDEFNECYNTKEDLSEDENVK